MSMQDDKFLTRKQGERHSVVLLSGEELTTLLSWHKLLGRHYDPVDHNLKNKFQDALRRLS